VAQAGGYVARSDHSLRIHSNIPADPAPSVAATDAAGNTDPTPAKAKFKVKKAKKGKHGGKGKGGK